MRSLSIYGLLPQKKVTPRLLFLLVPGLFLALSLYTLSVQGPFYSFANIDPSYAYLLNGFELLHFHPPGHVDHPGTTTQIFMSLVILCKWLFTAIPAWIGQYPIPHLDHLFFTEAEGFLYVGAIALILVNAMLFSAVSFNLFNLCRKLEIVFIFQLSIFLFFPAVQTFSSFMPEPMLLTSLLLVCLTVFPILFKNEGPQPKYARNFGLAFGFGMATKVTFLPLGLLLFLYPKNHRKKLIKFAMISFLVCTFPIWGRYLNMAKWLVKIAFHDGIYGTGSTGIIDSTKIVENAHMLFQGVPFLFMSLAGLSSYLWFFYNKTKPVIKKFLILSLGALLFSLCLNLKHPGIRYMIPVLLLCAPICAAIAYQTLQQKRIYILGLYAFIGLGIGFSALDYQKWHEQALLENEGRESFNAYVAEQGCKVIGFNNPSLQSYALYFGNQWAKKNREDILAKYYPDTIFFEPAEEVFYGFAGHKRDKRNTIEIESQLKNYPCTVFQGQHFNLPKNSVYQSRLSLKTLDAHQSLSAQFYELDRGGS